MIKSTIDPDCTGQFSPLFLDYIQQNEKLRPFYHLFPSLSNFKSLIQKRSFDVERRKVLVTSLQAQYAGFELPDITQQNILSLNHATTFTVTTGHQLNLYTGPLYFIYKIVSTINLADKLRQTYPAYHFVPVYWMASEDHDFAEINHYYFDGEEYAWHTDQKGAVGEFILDAGIRDLLDKASFTPDFFKKAYLDHTSLAEAVRDYVNYLFGAKGLIVVDGNSSDLKALFKSTIKDDLIRHSAQQLVGETTRKLEELGYKSQIYPREVNFFYLDKGIRERIEKVGGNYQVLESNLSFTAAEIEQLIETQPEKFSPNVVMRPLYQETILPNLAYIGGPAEVAYWLELKDMCDHYGVDFPAVMPRNFVMVLDNYSQRKMDALKLNDQDVFMDFDQWKKHFVINHAEQDVTLSQEKNQLADIFQAIEEKAALADLTLKPAAVAAHKRASKILGQFSTKLRKAEERKLRTALDRMQHLKQRLFPHGSPQERISNFLQFYLEDPAFIDKLYPHLDPLDFDFIMLRTNGDKS